MGFKPIKGYEGIYEACSDGTIWSSEGKVTYSNWHGKIGSASGSVEKSSRRYKSE